MPLFGNALAGAAGQSGSGPYEIQRSLRFNDNDSAHLTKTLSSGNRKKWTYSAWVKRQEFTQHSPLLAVNSSEPRNYIRFTDDYLYVGGADGDATGSYFGVRTPRVFRDPSAWYHIVVVMDSDQATAADRTKIYVNGVLNVESTSDGYLNQGQRPQFNSGDPHYIGWMGSGSSYFNGLIADVHFLDGIAVSNPDGVFGEFDADTGVWSPIKFTGSYNGPGAGSGVVYSDGVSSPQGLQTSNPAANAFDGSTSTAATTVTANTSPTLTVTFSPPLTNVTSLRMYTGNIGSNQYATGYGLVNGTSISHSTLGASYGAGWVDFTGHFSGTTVNSMGLGQTNAGTYALGLSINAIEVNGTVLVDGTPAGVNGFRLNFSDNSSKDALGTDTSGNNNTWTVNNLTPSGVTFSQTSVANATGALPIYNTTGTYGDGIASPLALRSDSLASYLQWCIPTSQGSSGQLNDQSPSGRTSSTRNVNGGPGSHSTSQSQFYGGSNYLSSGTSGNFSTDVWGSIASSNSEFTIEFWIYLDSTFQNNGYGSTVFSSRPAGDNGAGWIDIGFGGISGNKPRLRLQVSQGWDFKFNLDGSNNDAAFPSGQWVHVAVARDSNNKVRLFGNGVLLQTQTSNVGITNNNRGLYGGHSYGAYASYVNFYLQDIRIYSTCKYSSSFNPPRATTSLLNGEKQDSLIDSPTNYDDGTNIGGNFCTWNPLTMSRGNITDGNLLFYGDGTNTPRVNGTFSQSSGKWYYEATVLNDGPGTGSGDVHNSIGWGLDTVTQIESAPNTSAMNHSFYFMDSGWYKNFSGSNTNTNNGKWLTGDVIGVAADLDNNTITFYRNGTSVLSQTIGVTAGTRLCPAHQSNTGNYGKSATNFGQQPFVYPPGGTGGPAATFKALCSTNLPDPSIANGSNHFDVKLHTGNGSAQTISGFEFSPDFVWVKQRSTTRDHRLANTIRGTGKDLRSNADNAEITDANGITAFNSDGFSVGSGSGWNENVGTYVSWAWSAGENSNKTYTVKVVSDSGNKFRFDNFSGSAVTLDLAEGSTYIFDQSDSSNAGHPIRFGTSANGTDYTTGVTHTGTPGSAGAKTTLVLGTGVGTLYYSCANHSGMGGQINTNSTAGSSNFDGDVQSTVKANQTAGFSIVKWTNNGNNTPSSHRWGHGLLGIPDVVIVKRLNTAGNWTVYSEAYDNPVRDELYLDTNNPIATAGVNLYHRDSTTVGIRAGSIGVSGDQHVAFVFKVVDGFSAVGTYDGTGNNNGEFVFTNFRPAFLMYKNMTNSGFNWGIIDSTRGPYNYLSRTLNPNTSSVESNRNSNDAFDFLSNGFKVRAGGSNARNQSGAKFFYIAFAENPFSSNGGLAR